MKQIFSCGCVPQGRVTMSGVTREGCGLHMSFEVLQPAPDLSNRKAQCSCGRTVPSSPDLAFFHYRGPGSSDATNICKCAYYAVAHKYDASRRDPEPVKCKVGGFTPHGPYEFDVYYCGCAGWD